MRIDHIENFNIACASVGKLAAEAIAEHRRQIEQIETVGREAARLAQDLSREERRKTADTPAPVLPGNDRLALRPEPPALAERPAVPPPPDLRTAIKGPAAAVVVPADEEGVDDVLTLAMQRAERDDPSPSEKTQLDSLRRRRASDFAPPAANESRQPEPDGSDPVEPPPADQAVLARGRELVASLRKRTRR